MVSFNVHGFVTDNEKASALAIAMTKVIKYKTAAAVKAKRAFVPSAICNRIHHSTPRSKQRVFTDMMAVRLFAREIDTNCLPSIFFYYNKHHQYREHFIKKPSRWLTLEGFGTCLFV
ncbi:hypothetical protein P8917_14040 [Bacillus atrophaeus]|uniref:hypothetical protein n=2 Tax=Bacillus atrophaeus TaxID=1452 RepID=UPI00227FD1A7|nr:hypothetical protein [Bacillus atrophaeus]MCY8497895.1 hypothetical protein [Bacillus atrophaeus]MCY8814229.1 hypothetical protein [Bacillus atrophaeus]MCY8822057.1 hypothetical protein [Bacillus atrophaeus]MCY8834825.1 hypothetical protein [Bacillus atrophaeus]MEC0751966.1 hypothetical protein [Bacillus atrophaeus]